MPSEDTFLRALRHRGHGVVLVHDRDVVEYALASLVHPSEPVSYDDGNLESVSGIVGHEVGDRIGKDVTVAILMLQSFTSQCRPTRGRLQ